MTIDRKLGRLTPVREPEGDRIAAVPGDFNVVNERAIEAREIPGELQKNAGLLKSRGEALLETGNHWQGMPQLHPEFRAYAETAIDLDVENDGPSSGLIIIDPSRSNVFSITLNGPASIEIAGTWPQGYNSSAGIDVSVSLLIEKNADELTITPTHWGPNGSPPDFSQAGFYEISMAVCVFPDRTISRAWCSIKDTSG